MDIQSWRLDEWTESYSKGKNLPAMTSVEIKEAVDFLRTNFWPKPVDCPSSSCRDYRPSCLLGTCYIGMRLSGDMR